LEQGVWRDSEERGGFEGEIVGIGDPEASELEHKEAIRGEYIDRKQIGPVVVTGRSETEFSRWGWT